MAALLSITLSTGKSALCCSLDKVSFRVLTFAPSRTLNGYFGNGKKNGWSTADSSDEATLDDIFDSGITTAGVFTLPVCGGTEAWTNWHYYSSGARDKTDNYPCN